MKSYELIAKKLANEISNKEENELQYFLSESEENKKIYEQCKMIWKNSENLDVKYSFDNEKALSQTKKLLSKTEKSIFSCLHSQ